MPATGEFIDEQLEPVLYKLARCAIYTRKSTEHNLDLAFNSLDAQREAREAYKLANTMPSASTVPRTP
jgi:hypothetical protein